MSILHLNIAAFPIEIERQRAPRLRLRPVVIAAASNARAPLLSVSREAYALGLRKGMRLGAARAQERGLTCLLPNPPLYQRAQRCLLKIVQRFTPVFEPLRPGSVFLDMSGTRWLFGSGPDAASKVRAAVLRELALDLALGLAENKLVARIAAKVMRPVGLCDVFPGNEADFLRPLEVDLLPGLGAAIATPLLRELNIRFIGDIAQVPPSILLQLFGKPGIKLSERSHGIDRSPVQAPARTPRLVAAAVLAEPSNDDGRLQAQLWSLIETLGRELRSTQRMAGAALLHGLYVDRRETELRVAFTPS